jgi:hypothetical protein
VTVNKEKFILDTDIEGQRTDSASRNGDRVGLGGHLVFRQCLDPGEGDGAPGPSRSAAGAEIAEPSVHVVGDVIPDSAEK